MASGHDARLAARQEGAAMERHGDSFWRHGSGGSETIGWKTFTGTRLSLPPPKFTMT